MQGKSILWKDIYNVREKSEARTGGRIALRVFLQTFTGMASAVVLAFSGGAALAAPPPATSAPMKCFQEWDANENYDREGWIGAKVADVKGIFLGCGNRHTGIIHIAHPESTGTIHPIFANTQTDFLRCFEAIANTGKRSPDPAFPAERTRVELTYEIKTDLGRLPQTATLIFDNARRFVYTMFTSNGASSPNGDNWSGCRGIPV